MYKYILASGSPRRRELLSLLGIEFTVSASDCCEKTDKTEPSEAAADIALAKCKSAVENSARKGLLLSESVVISADTSVVLDGQTFGKPSDGADAYRMLSALSGRTHSVYTGVCVYFNEEYSCFCERTDVEFCQMSRAEISEYIRTDEPFDKAGAYGIQGFGAKFIKKIDGDFFNVVGLPVCRLYNFLSRLLPGFAC